MLTLRRAASLQSSLFFSFLLFPFLPFPFPATKIERSTLLTQLFRLFHRPYRRAVHIFDRLRLFKGFPDADNDSQIYEIDTLESDRFVRWSNLSSNWNLFGLCNLKKKKISFEIIGSEKKKLTNYRMILSEY